MKTLSFTKMQGLGNDFIVLDGVRTPLALNTAQLCWLADRHFGVGCDQILWVEPARDPANDFRYRIFNRDGGEVANCGNGVRCFARFVHDQKLTQATQLRVETQSGVLQPELLPDGQVQVNMGQPIFDPERIPFLTEGRHPTYDLQVGAHKRIFSVISMGNPHAVQIVNHVESAPVAVEGPLIEHHAAFPERVNAGFVEIVSRSHIRLRVFERGSGETLACGTGACAAVVAGQQRGLLDPAPVKVSTHGGTLTISWAGEQSPVWMTGPATTVFTGTVAVPDIEEILHAGC
ncbi:MAG: diaminopimelate epimerase [Ferrovum sp.]|nr:diaminopimelate epimerase [Ferrovum sp.]NDU86666.1 diaminopimelate epimerase [Ferrovum sp.]